MLPHLYLCHEESHFLPIHLTGKTLEFILYTVINFLISNVIHT